jgi:hypothetical protein
MMIMPVHTNFQRMMPTEDLRSVIDRHSRGLEDRFKQVAGCRMALKALAEITTMEGCVEERDKCWTHSSRRRARC